MSAPEVHQCECATCQQKTLHLDQVLHREMNFLLSRLDEQQRRWYVAVEADRVGPQGDGHSFFLFIPNKNEDTQSSRNLDVRGREKVPTTIRVQQEMFLSHEVALKCSLLLRSYCAEQEVEIARRELQTHHHLKAHGQPEA